MCVCVCRACVRAWDPCVRGTPCDVACSSFVQEKALPAFVGYANLPNQVFRKAVKRGFQFTLMVVGKHYCILGQPASCSRLSPSPCL